MIGFMLLTFSVPTDQRKARTASSAMEEDKDFVCLVYVCMVYANYCSL